MMVIINRLSFWKRSIYQFHIVLFCLLTATTSVSGQTFYTGVDLSYVNEMEDCGAVYYEDNVAKDPYAIFSDQGANLVRLRLWHTPDWTEYSTLTDVKKAIAKTKDAGMQAMLDFHYSDTWTDPGAQQIPAAWNAVETLETLADSVYAYTYAVLKQLGDENLLPELVQLGNEINGNILLKEGEDLYPINWSRNKLLLDRAADAVDAINNEYSTAIKTILHVAKPEDAIHWFSNAAQNGINRYDIIGLSYYPGWSSLSLREAAHHVKTLKETHGKDVLIVETGYPWTLGSNDNANNVLGSDNLLAVYDGASPENQRDFLIELAFLVKENGGLGVVYWEPAWVSTPCSTLWGEGSHYENATFFDFDNNLNAAAEFLGYDYTIKPEGLHDVEVKFLVEMVGVDTANGAFVTGDFTGEPWQHEQMTHVKKRIYEFTTSIPGRSEGAYIFYNRNSWLNAYRENVPSNCALYWDDHRKYIVKDEPISFEQQWSSCAEIDWEDDEDPVLGIEHSSHIKKHPYPNPSTGIIYIPSLSSTDQVVLYDITGKQMDTNQLWHQSDTVLDLSSLSKGIYTIKIIGKENTYASKIMLH